MLSLNLLPPSQVHVWKNLMIVYCLIWRRYGNAQIGFSGSYDLAQIWRWSAFHDKKVYMWRTKITLTSFEKFIDW